MKRLIPILLLFPAPLAASPIAEVICAPTDRMEARLTAGYGRERRSSGVRSPEQIIEIWTDKSGDWTLVIRYASGRSCIVAMGEYWQGPENPA